MIIIIPIDGYYLINGNVVYAKKGEVFDFITEVVYLEVEEQEVVERREKT